MSCYLCKKPIEFADVEYIYPQGIQLQVHDICKVELLKTEAKERRVWESKKRRQRRNRSIRRWIRFKRFAYAAAYQLGIV